MISSVCRPASNIGSTPEKTHAFQRFAFLPIKKVGSHNTLAMNSLLGTLNMSSNSIRIIVTDIEGTTSSISFVHEILFPYAAENLAPYLNRHAQDKAVIAILQEVK